MKSIAKTIGRSRSEHQAYLLEILCSKHEATCAELSWIVRRNYSNVLSDLNRMLAQGLVVKIAEGKRGWINTPSVWQLRETYERR